MRRTASEVIRNLLVRVARLENIQKQATNLSTPTYLVRGPATFKDVFKASPKVSFWKKLFQEVDSTSLSDPWVKIKVVSLVGFDPYINNPNNPDDIRYKVYQLVFEHQKEHRFTVKLQWSPFRDQPKFLEITKEEDFYPKVTMKFNYNGGARDIANIMEKARSKLYFESLNERDREKSRPSTAPDSFTIAGYRVTKKKFESFFKHGEELKDIPELIDIKRGPRISVVLLKANFGSKLLVLHLSPDGNHSRVGVFDRGYDDKARRYFDISDPE